MYEVDNGSPSIFSVCVLASYNHRNKLLSVDSRTCTGVSTPRRQMLTGPRGTWEKKFIYFTFCFREKRHATEAPSQFPWWRYDYYRKTKRKNRKVLSVYIGKRSNTVAIAIVQAMYMILRLWAISLGRCMTCA